MALKLDHVIVAVHDLDVAIKDYRELGFTVSVRRTHKNGHIHSALVIFSDGTYIELMANSEQLSVNATDFSSLLNGDEGLVAYALHADDLDAEIKRLRSLNFTVSEPFLSEWQQSDGTIIQYRIATIDNAYTPFLIEDITPREIRVPISDSNITHENQAVRLKYVEIVTRDIEKSYPRYVDILGYSLDTISYGHKPIHGVYIHMFEQFFASMYPVTEYPEHLRVTARGLSPEEIANADPAQEPKSLATHFAVQDTMLKKLQRNTKLEHARAMSLDDKQETMHGIHLVLEAELDDRFTLKKTHNLNVVDLTGAPMSRLDGKVTRLDDVDWASVKHAYGLATDVPYLLCAIASEIKAVRDDAYEYLYSSIVHQGTIYGASVETVPYLLQLVNTPNVQEKHRILDLLGWIIGGARGQAMETTKFGGMDAETLAERLPKILEFALPIYLEQLNNTNPKIRRGVTSKLVDYPSELNTFEPLLKGKIESDPDDYVCSTYLSTLVTLWTKVSGNDDAKVYLSDAEEAYVAKYFHSSSRPILQFTAAIKLLKHDPNHWVDEATQLFYDLFDGELVVPETVSIGFYSSMILWEVKDALKNNPEKVVEWIVKQVKHTESTVRVNAIQELRSFIEADQHMDKIIPAIRSALKDESPDVREKAIQIASSNKQTLYDIYDLLKQIAENDNSIFVRRQAQNVLRGL